MDHRTITKKLPFSLKVVKIAKLNVLSATSSKLFILARFKIQDKRFGSSQKSYRLPKNVISKKTNDAEGHLMTNSETGLDQSVGTKKSIFFFNETLQAIADNASSQDYLIRSDRF